jgi:hypothetical protein
MRAFGAFLLIIGLGWAAIGIAQGCSSFLALVNNPNAVGAESTGVALSWVLNGIVYVFPGFVVAGISALVRRFSQKQVSTSGSSNDIEAGTRVGRNARVVAEASEMGESGEMKSCPFCAEHIRAAAVVCRYCGRDLPT